MTDSMLSAMNLPYPYDGVSTLTSIESVTSDLMGAGAAQGEGTVYHSASVYRDLDSSSTLARSAPTSLGERSTFHPETFGLAALTT